MSDDRYLTSEEVIAEFRFTSRGAFDSFLYHRRKTGRPVTCRHRGRRLLFRRSDIEAAMRLERAKQPREAR